MAMAMAMALVGREEFFCFRPVFFFLSRCQTLCSVWTGVTRFGNERMALSLGRGSPDPAYSIMGGIFGWAALSKQMLKH